jgi:hypothetical protein
MARLRCLGAVLCAALALPHVASAQAFRVGDNANFGGTPQTLYPDVAYDPVNKRYFEVTTASSHTVIEGRFVTPTAPSSNSYELSGTVTISTASFLNEYPRVSYSPHVAGGGGFLVTWHKGFSSGSILFAKVMGRIYSASGAALTDEFVVSTSTGSTGTNASHYGMGAPSAYSTGSQEFLVVWTSTKYEVIGQRLSTTGAANGGNFLISQGGVGRYDRDPSVAYSPAVDKFYVGWGVFSDASNSGHAEGRLVSASTGALGSILALDNAKGVSITSVAYNATADQFLFSWYHDDGVGYQYTYGAVVSSGGSPVTPIRVLSSLYSAYNALDVEFNQLAGEYFLVTHGNDSLSNGKEDFGVSIRSDGTAYDNGFRVTVTNAAGGNYNPRVATSADRKEWLVVTSTNFLQVSGQFVGSNSTGSGTPPPPPPPGCSFNLSSSSAAFGAGGGSAVVTLNASDTSCAWTASSNASWVTLSSSSGSGSAGITYNVAANSSQSTRTATLAIGGRSYSISQEGVTCTFTVNSLSLDLAYEGGNGTLSVSAPAGCAWSASSQSPMLSFPDGAGRLGSGTVSINVARNYSTSPITSTAQVAGQTVTVFQSGVPTDSNARTRESSRADFDGDGHTDLFWQDSVNGYMAFWRLQGGTSTWDARALSLSAGDANWQVVGTGDFNGDGRPDLVWHHRTSGMIYLWYMNGTTRIGHAPFSVTGISDTRWKIAGVGDFNGDGKPDLVWQHDTLGWLAVWLVSGTTITAGLDMLPGQVDVQWKIAGVGDLNADGHSDLVWRNTQNGELGAWLMNGATRTQYVSISPRFVEEQTWRIVSIIDVNGDQTPDLVWHHATQGWVAVWYMNGALRMDVQTFPIAIELNWKIAGPK